MEGKERSGSTLPALGVLPEKSPPLPHEPVVGTDKLNVDVPSSIPFVIDHDLVWAEAVEQCTTTCSTPDEFIRRSLVPSARSAFLRGTMVHFVQSKVIMLLQVSNGPRPCFSPDQAREQLDCSTTDAAHLLPAPCHDMVIVQQILSKRIQTGLGTTAIQCLRRACQTLHFCVIIQCPVTAGGHALVKKLHAVDPFQSGNFTLCRECL
jgi:hypothetical protein